MGLRACWTGDVWRMVALAESVRLDAVVPSAVVSILGVSGWGPLHLRMQGPGDPAALLQRLRKAWWQAAASAEGRPSPALLIASLLRGQGDLFPLLPGQLSEGQAPLYRHRLVCRRDRPVLEWSGWQIAPGCSRCVGPLLLSHRLLTGRPSAAELAVAGVSVAAMSDSQPGAAVLRAPARSGAARCDSQPTLLAQAPGLDRPGLRPTVAASIQATPTSASGPRHGASDRLPPAAGGL